MDTFENKVPRIETPEHEPLPPMPRAGITPLAGLMTGLVLLDLLFSPNHIFLSFLAWPLVFVLFAGLTAIEKNMRKLSFREMRYLVVGIAFVFAALFVYGMFTWYWQVGAHGIGYQVFFLLYWVKRFMCRCLKISRARGYDRPQSNDK